MTITAQLQGKVIALTGGASGIGLATAHLLASRGAKVSIADLHPNLEEVAKSVISATGNPNVIATKVDIRDVDAVAAWIERTVKEFGPLDGAANMAGVYQMSPNGTIAQEDQKNWEFMLDVNLTGAMHCMRAELSHMNPNGGSIVNAASILATRGWAGACAYSASKHGVVGLTKSAAREVGLNGVRVNCIAPYVYCGLLAKSTNLLYSGYIDTPMVKAAVADPDKATVNHGGASATPLGRMGKPEEVAGLIGFLLSDDSTFITGACINIDGGMSA